MTKRLPVGLILASVVLALSALLAWPASSWAVGLDQAKSQGLVGEQPNGYLGIVPASVSAEVKALVADINAKRRARYQEIAKRNGTSLEVVEALAGKTAIEKTPAGQYVRTPSGQWVKK